jgi:hypothetical protein
MGLASSVRKVIAIVVLTTVLAGIVAVFWYQEIQYLMPTPVPKDYKIVRPSEIIQFDTTLLPQRHTKPILLHFFSPDCPCSRFNLAHFNTLRRMYGNTVNFYTVVASNDQAEAAKKMLTRDIPIVIDHERKLALACGVYSTPQAALIQSNNQLYYRGNYNRSRYCTDANSNYVQMALDSLMAHRSTPRFSELATQSYGCHITDKKSFF